jgi:hypothetical protein
LVRAGVRAASSELLRGLRLGEVPSQGIDAMEGGDPKSIPPDRWAEWKFNLDRQSLDPPSRRRIATGFESVRIARADVERLAQRLIPAPSDKPADQSSDVVESSHDNRPEVVAVMLIGRYPDGPPQKRNSEIISDLHSHFSATLGHLSERTLSRAKAIAWPQLRRRVTAKD